MATNKKWADADRQAFANGVRNKAQTFADRKKRQNKGACRNFRWKGE